ncbi:unnamed protein product, partial [Cuscuta epithymum]
MRLRTETNEESLNDTQEFAKWILHLGDGPVITNQYGESEVEIPADLLIHDVENPIQSLVTFAYPDMLNNYINLSFFEDRAILAPTLEAVEKINSYILSLIPLKETEYLSSDSTCQADENYEL